MPRIVKRKYTEREREYLTYIAEHTDNVATAWIQVKKLLTGNLGMDYMPEFDFLIKVATLVFAHDDSKYSFEEFDGYRNYFYPDNGIVKEDAKENFNKAWEHHKNNNPHHWEFWVEEAKGTKARVIKPMPLCYTIEMLCDWSGMSLKFGDSPEDFYKKKKDKIDLHPDTRNKVEELMPYFVMAVEIERQQQC